MPTLRLPERNNSGLTYDEVAEHYAYSLPENAPRAREVRMI